MLDFIHQNIFLRSFTGKAIQHCMFKQILQIGHHGQNLLGKEGFDVQSDLI